MEVILLTRCKMRLVSKIKNVFFERILWNDNDKDTFIEIKLSIHKRVLR